MKGIGKPGREVKASGLRDVRSAGRELWVPGSKHKKGSGHPTLSTKFGGNDVTIVKSKNWKFLYAEIFDLEICQLKDLNLSPVCLDGYWRKTLGIWKGCRDTRKEIWEVGLLVELRDQNPY